MLTYEQCVEKMAKCRGGQSKGREKLENNTYLTYCEVSDSFCVWMYSTCIVSIYRHGLYELNTRSHRTVTTKARLNKYGPVSVHQKKGEWFVGPYGDTFYDGVIVMTADTRQKLASVVNISMLRLYDRLRSQRRLKLKDLAV